VLCFAPEPPPPPGPQSCTIAPIAPAGIAVCDCEPVRTVVETGEFHVPSPRKKLLADGVPVTAFVAILVTVEMIVPFVGIVSDVAAVAVRVLANAPAWVKFPATVIVLDPLLTPVPP
jgi:hypothetical protein